MALKPVDTAIKVLLGPCIDDTDFKTREESLTYDQSGIEITVVLEKTDGTVTTTAVTPTTGGVYDWAHTNQGYYELELPASGGANYNNDTEGLLTVIGYCTGVLPFRSVSYDIVPVKVYNSLVAGSDNLEVDAVAISGDSTAADNAESFFDGTGYAGTNNVIPTVTTTTNLTNAATSGDFTATQKASISTAVFGYVAENSKSFLTMFRLMYAVLLNKVSGGGTTTITFRDDGDSKDRVTMTVDSDGDRSAVVKDGS